MEQAAVEQAAVEQATAAALEAVAVAAAAAEAGLNIGGGNPAPPADGEVAAREADFDEDVRPLRVG